MFLAKPKTYRCPGCDPDDPMREVVVLYGVTVHDVTTWDGTVSLHCRRHGSFSVKFRDEVVVTNLEYDAARARIDGSDG